MRRNFKLSSGICSLNETEKSFSFFAFLSSYSSIQLKINLCKFLSPFDSQSQTEIGLIVSEIRRRVKFHSRNSVPPPSRGISFGVRFYPRNVGHTRFIHSYPGFTSARRSIFLFLDKQRAHAGPTPEARCRAIRRK